MRTFTKFACLPLLVATAAFAFNKTTYHWPKSKIEYHHSTNEACQLKLVSAYQPGGEQQPIHLKMQNVGHNRLAYDISIFVDGVAAGTFSVDNIGTETNDRDASERFRGNVNGSTLKVVVTSCRVRKD